MNEVINVKILHLVLKKKWYEMVAEGKPLLGDRVVHSAWLR